MVALLFGGCLDQRFVWSPDGSRAAVVTQDGLYLCDASGKLSGLLAPHVLCVAWAGDSSHLLLERSVDMADSAAVGSALGAARTAAIAARSEIVWSEIQAGATLDKVSREEGEESGVERLFLRERHDAELDRRLGVKWREVRTLPVSLFELVAARVEGDRLEFGRSLVRDVSAFCEIRPAPGGNAVAFVSGRDLHPGNDYRLSVVAGDADAPPVLVADHTGMSADWTPDGRSLEFLQASDPHGGGDLRLGTLVRQTVRWQDGRIQVSGDAVSQVGVIFHDQDRVRCLPDGRVLFSAAEFRLPMLAASVEKGESLFAFDPSLASPLSTLVSRDHAQGLPDALSWFEVSPDASQILFGGNDGECWLLTLSTGRVEAVGTRVVSPKSQDNLTVFAPSWRRAGEFTFARQADVKGHPGLTAAADVVLRAGGRDTVLSADWPDPVRAAFVK